jgi:hypothetical protein
MTNRKPIPSYCLSIQDVDHSILFLPKRKLGIDISDLVVCHEASQILTNYQREIEEYDLTRLTLHEQSIRLYGMGYTGEITLDPFQMEQLLKCKYILESFPYEGIFPLGKNMVKEIGEFLSGSRMPVDTLNQKAGTVPMCICFEYYVYSDDDYFPVVDAIHKVFAARKFLFGSKEKAKIAKEELNHACIKARLFDMQILL